MLENMIDSKMNDEEN